jgi:hypothetical protein
MARSDKRWTTGACWSYAIGLQQAMLRMGVQDPQLYDLIIRTDDERGVYMHREDDAWYVVVHVVVRVGDHLYDAEGEHDADGLIRRWKRRLSRTIYKTVPLRLIPHSPKRALDSRIRTSEDDVYDARENFSAKVVTLARVRRG